MFFFLDDPIIFRGGAESESSGKGGKESSDEGSLDFVEDFMAFLRAGFATGEGSSYSSSGVEEDLVFVKILIALAFASFVYAFEISCQNLEKFLCQKNC